MAQRAPLRTVVVVGLGAVARTHLAVLEDFTSIDVICGVDPDPDKHLTFRGRSLTVFRNLNELSGGMPDLFIVATPTPTHRAVHAEIARLFPGTQALVEKPAADNLPDAGAVLDTSGGLTTNIAYHMACSPEVLWAAKLVDQAADEFGEIVSAQLVFTDPYEQDFDAASATYGSSWIDSGINALSVLRRFCDSMARRSLRSVGERRWSAYEAVLECRRGSTSFDATLLTSWHVTDPGRSTRLLFSTGHELLLDHHAVSAYRLHEGEVVDLFGTDGAIPRREAHYRALYEEFFAIGRVLLTSTDSFDLHKTLLESLPSA
jgi:predicted dehydrogenase